MIDFQQYTFEQVIEEFIDYRGKTPQKTSSGIPLLTAKIVKNGFIEEPDEFIAEDYYEEWMRRGLPQKGDVVMTTEAPLGEVAQLTSDERIALGQRIITLRGKPDLLDNTYLRFALQGSTLQSRLKARGTGSTVQGIKSAELKKVIIDLPPLSSQKKISRVLGNLDDKIELNRKMNKTLESMAMTLYRHYFIDFGLAPGAKFEADECPFGKLVDTNEMGPIPEGWDVVELKEIIHFKRVGVTAKNIMPDMKYIGLEHLTKRSVHFDSWGYGKDVNSNKLQFKKGDILYGKIRPYFKKLTIAPFDGICSTDIIVMNGKKEWPNAFILSLMLQDDFLNYANSGSSGTKMPRADEKHICKYFVALPKDSSSVDNILRLFEKISSQLIDNINQTSSLKETRNYLLPKLLSGEVQVK